MSKQSFRDSNVILRGLSLVTLVATAISTVSCAPPKSHDVGQAQGTGKAASSAGPGSSGGGDTELSTPEQVKASVEMAALMAGTILNLKGEWPFKNPKANAISEAIRIRLDVNKLRDGGAYQLLDECTDADGKRHAGGAVIGDANSPFCLSLPMLQKTAPSDLYYQLIPLIGHEMAHQAGYGEEDAKLFQAQALKRTRNFNVKAATHLLVEDTLEMIKEAIALLNQNAPLEQVCASVGAIRGKMEGIDRLAVSYGSYVPATVMNEEEKAEMMLGLELYGVKIADTRTYCGLPARKTMMGMGEAWDTPKLVVLEKGDSAGLLKSLNEVAASLGRILPLLSL